MKSRPHPMLRFLAILLFARQRLAPLLLTFLFLVSRLAVGADREWTGTTNTTWSTTTNWNGGVVPGSTDNAKFDLTFGNQPNLTANATVGGLWMTTGVQQNVTISASASTLTLQGNTINGTAGLGILIDNTSTYTLTISAPLTIGAAQTWRNNSGNLFTVSGTVNLNGFGLTIDGSGNTTVSGVVAQGGPGANSLTKNGSGTLTLSGANTYGGGTTLNAGTLNINNGAAGGKSSAIGTGTLTINGGTIDNTSGGAITLSTNNNITFGGNFTFGGSQDLTFGGGKVNNGGNYTVTLNGTNSTLTFGGAMNNTLNAAQTTTVNGAGNTLSFAGYNLNNAGQIDTINGTGDVTITGAIAPTGGKAASGLTYSGTGELTLSGSNTFTGTLTVQSGTLSIATINNARIAGTLGNSNNAVVLGGNGTTGTLEYTGATASSTKPFTLATGGTGAFQSIARAPTLRLAASSAAAALY